VEDLAPLVASAQGRGGANGERREKVAAGAPEGAGEGSQPPGPRRLRGEEGGCRAAAGQVALTVAAAAGAGAGPCFAAARDLAGLAGEDAGPPEGLRGGTGEI